MLSANGSEILPCLLCGRCFDFRFESGGFETRLIMHFSHVNMIKMVKKNIDRKTVFIFISGGDVLGTCHM